MEIPRPALTNVFDTRMSPLELDIPAHQWNGHYSPKDQNNHYRISETPNCFPSTTLTSPSTSFLFKPCPIVRQHPCDDIRPRPHCIPSSEISCLPEKHISVLSSRRFTGSTTERITALLKWLTKTLAIPIQNKEAFLVGFFFKFKYLNKI